MRESRQPRSRLGAILSVECLRTGERRPFTCESTWPALWILIIALAGCATSGQTADLKGTSPAGEKASENGEPLVYLKQMQISEIASRERSRGSRRIDPEREYLMPGTKYDLAQPYILFRKGSSFRPLPIARYQFSIPDSTVRFETYEWDDTPSPGGKFAKRRDLGAHDPSKDAYVEKFRELRSSVVKRIGPPTESKPLHKEVDDKGPHWVWREHWKYGQIDGDRIEVYMWMVYREHGMRRIRCRVKWPENLQQSEGGSTR